MTESIATAEGGQSAAPSAPDTIPTSDASTASTSAFLVHSQDTSSVGLQSSGVNSSNPRQKRRRTSPEDQAILEAEFEKNHKPDKVARAEIVKRVALGEKEVQIWFQNRRQMTRRRSQPPVFGFDTSYFSSQGNTGSSAYSSFSWSQYSLSDPSSSQTSIPEKRSVHPELAPTVPVAESEQPQPSAAAGNKPLTEGERENSAGPQHNDLAPNEAVAVSPGRRTGFPIVNFATLAKKKTKPLMRRHHSAFSIHQDDQTMPEPGTKHFDSFAKETDSVDTKSATPKHTSSLVHLSTSLEGNAKVAIGSSPSPPKLRAPRPITGLQRSQSAIEPSKHKTKSRPAVVAQKALMPGRSRDSRTWEFYCNSSAQDALTEHAEREQSGSAASAIGLIRSRSNKALASNPNKRNARPEKAEPIKRLKADDSRSNRRTLTRAKSSIARLQTVESDTKLEEIQGKHRKPGSQIELAEDGDSDKENWEPGTESRPPRRRPQPSTRLPRTVLEESLRIPSHSSSLDRLLDSEKMDQPKRVSPKENQGKAGDEELQKFMADAQLPREPEELDCVQNLLSLSQAPGSKACWNRFRCFI